MLVHLECPSCHKKTRALVNSEDDIGNRKCCGVGMVRVGSAGPSTTVVERLDNGAMARALERYSDAEQVMAERRQNADPLAGLKNFS